ncbi:MAG: sel1 repeat family protein [Betaproteobacteria bacterium]|nr:sel1 repeat family protein [Betaproteobacteria bacterium]
MFAEIAPVYESGDHYAAFVRTVESLKDKEDAALRTLLARMYLLGQGTVRHVPTALMHYEKAAAAGYAPAQFVYAQMLDRGIGMPADPAKAAKILEAAAMQGLPEAMVALAAKYEAGSGVAKDMGAAYKWLQSVAQSSGAASREVVDRVETQRKAVHAALDAQQAAAADREAAAWRKKARAADRDWARPVNATPNLDEVAAFVKRTQAAGDADRSKADALIKDYFPKQ